MMSEAMTIAARALDAIGASGLVPVEQVEKLRTASGGDTEVGEILVERGLITAVQLGAVLEEELGFPRVDLASYAPDDEALELVPASVAHAYDVLPLFEIEGTLTVAVGDPLDVFKLDALSNELGLAIDAVLADPEAVRDAISSYFPDTAAAPSADADVAEPSMSTADFIDLQEDDTPAVHQVPSSDVEPGIESVAQTVEEVVEAAASGAHAIDLDVLAVADEGKIAVLVSDILSAAVTQGANRIHLLPYKSDFFLVFRVKGRLEKVASAPLSMQQPLVEGLKTYAKMGGTASRRPALGRMQAEIAGKQVVLTISSVPTVAGQRMVVSIAPAKPQPMTLSELGMPEAESKALYAMVERGRGLLLLSGTISGGLSSTYYALLDHAAKIGKTVYSVERSIKYEIPAVAQVLVNPSESVGARAYFAAGISQDTDVIAIDSMQTAEEVHLAIQAAGRGKLTIATFVGADIASATRRMLDLGVEPVSLSQALTLGVGQRLLRTNCPNCSVDDRSKLTKALPGLDANTTIRKGTGCPNCGKSGFVGTTAIFEMLPFTDPIRTVIAHDGSVDDIEKAAHAAGMRSLLRAGATKVAEGTVSPEELDRVLRFSE